MATLSVERLFLQFKATAMTYILVNCLDSPQILSKACKLLAFAALVGRDVITTKVSRKGLVNIPGAIRREFNIEEGDLLLWEPDRERGVIIVRVLKNPLKHLRGKYNDPRISYESSEGLADRLVLGEAGAGDRA